MLRTELCDMLGIEYPILSAGMGPSLVGEKTGAPVELVVAVSEAGGLGVLGAAGYVIEELRAAIREVRKLTNKPFGVDVLLPSQIVNAGDREFEGGERLALADLLETLPRAHYDWVMKVKEEMQLPDIDGTIGVGVTTSRPHAAVRVCLEEKVPLFCAGLGNPGFMVEKAHAAGVKVLGIAGNSKNVGRIAQSGADLVVAQGHEGGGHTGRVGSMALWPQAIDAAAPTPVLAAGGIGDGRGVAAALAIGCAGVWVGTRFLASDTGKTSRATYSRFHDLWEESGLEPLPFPVQTLLASAVVEMFNKEQMKEYMGPFAGQVVGLIKEIKPAAQILEDMVEEAAEILTRKLPERVTAK
jgi:NAD(P)H-dependent flavin oxidoreductase YrpB (nitropropane dioxygenase family)